MTFEALQTNGLSDAQYFHAANIFKNKLKIDFVTIKGSADTNVNKISEDLIKVIARFANEDRTTAILKSLCMGLTYMIFHLHQSMPAQEIVTGLESQLGSG